MSQILSPLMENRSMPSVSACHHNQYPPLGTCLNKQAPMRKCGACGNKQYNKQCVKMTIT
eukprot:12410563-Ditylum_brightwellii.AAC.1